ncbi:MAG: T9SS type A sorting domain-containing protein [Bacteroidota bacterium]
MKTKPTISAKINLIVIVFSIFSLLANTANSQNPEQLKVNPNYSSLAGSEIIISEFYTLCNLDSTLTISWEVRSEPNFTEYTILKSSDNLIWDKVITINGFNPGLSVYTYSYIEPFKNTTATYYKISAIINSGPTPITLEEFGVTAGPITAPLCNDPIDYSFSVYPNPSRDLVYAKVDGLKENQKCLFTIFNENGIPAMVTKGIQSKNSFYIDIINLKPGRYILMVEIPGVSIMSRLLVKV